MWAGISGKPWICSGWRPDSGLGNHPLKEPALPAKVHMYSCVCIREGIQGVGLAQD